MLLKVFRPKLIDYINISKVLDNYRRRCKCTSGEIIDIKYIRYVSPFSFLPFLFNPVPNFSLIPHVRKISEPPPRGHLSKFKIC